jgi:vitamin B12 transporter
VLFGLLSRCSLAALILFTAYGIAEAQAAPAPSPSPSQTPAAEIGRVATSDRRSEPIGQTSRPTFVVDRSQIDAEGARTLGDALVGVPGVELFPYGAFGAQVDFGIRGAASQRTLVLVDGQPIGDPTTGTVDLTQLSTAGVQRIEIVESAASALYGTSASGGVINVITNIPRGTYLEGSLGSFDDRDLRAGFGNGLIGASFERHVATNAYAYPAFTYGLPGCTTTAGTACNYSAGVRDNAYGDQSSGRISADLPLPAGFAVRGRLDMTSLDIGIPSRLDGLTPNTTNRLANDSGLVEVAQTTANGTLSIDLSGTTQRSAYADPSFGEDDILWGRSQFSLKDALTSRGADLVAGVDLTRASGIFAFPGYTIPASGTTPSTTVPASAIGASQSQAAAYLQVGTAPVSGARVVAGLRAEHDSPVGSVLAPSFGTTLRLAPNIRFAGNISESFTVPTLQDLYYPGYSNPNLQPEKSLDSDATLVLEGPRGALSFGWFGRRGSNFIVLDPTTFIPFNAQRAQTAGIAVTARSKPIHGLIADLNFTDLYRALDLTTDARLPRSPVGQASAGITRPFGLTRTAFGLRFGVVGSDGVDTANVPAPLIGSYDSYTSVDAYVRYKLSKDGIVSVRGFNLANDREAPIFGYPNVGRRFVVELSTR